MLMFALVGRGVVMDEDGVMDLLLVLTLCIVAIVTVDRRVDRQSSQQ